MQNAIVKTDINTLATFLKISGTLLVFIGAIAFFIYEIKGLPPRVTKLEQDFVSLRKELSSEISDLKSHMDKNDIKTDILLDDVKTIKTYIINHNENERRK